MKAQGLSMACVWVVGSVLLAGCTAQPRLVNCDERLEPINMPASKPEPMQEAVLAEPSTTGRAAP